MAKCSSAILVVIGFFGVLLSPLLIIGPILTLQKYKVSCDLSCNGTQPPFCIIPFDAYQHQNVTFSVKNYDKHGNGLFAGLYDPKEGGDGEFVATGIRQNKAFNVSARNIYMMSFMSLSRNSVIDIRCSAPHSIYLLIHTRNIIDNIPDTSIEMKESATVGAVHEGDTIKYNDKIMKNSVYKIKSREIAIRLTVNETSQYVVSFGNDSPFNIEVKDFVVEWKSRSPITGESVVNCTNIPFYVSSCRLNVPNEYEKDFISLVMHMNCSDYNATAIAEFEVSISKRMAYVFGLGFPGGIGLLIVIAVIRFSC